jgi:membrane protein YqaA with SNARE-associated domain
MLKKLYDWVLSLAVRKTVPVWLAIIAFVESSIFLVPADVVFIPMALSKPDRAYRFALIATIASVLGGVAGWMLGFHAYEAVAKPILQFYGKLDAFESLKSHIDDNWILALMVTSGLVHFPPIKVVTILAGVVHMNLPAFIMSAMVTRGLRFLWTGLAPASLWSPHR